MGGGGAEGPGWRPALFPSPGGASRDPEMGIPSAGATGGGPDWRQVTVYQSVASYVTRSAECGTYKSS